VSIVNNGRISSNDQKVDNKKFDKGYDEINWNSKKGKDGNTEKPSK
jgi:hypothetical protein